MTDSGLGGLALDPATRALLDFANSPAMKQAQLAFRGIPNSPAFKEAQKLAAAFRDVPNSPAFKEAQKLAAAFRDVPKSPAFKDAQKLAAAFRDVPNSPAFKDAQKLAAIFKTVPERPAFKEAQKLGAIFKTVPESPAFKEAQKLAAIFSSFADSPAMKEAQKLASAFSAFAASRPHDLPTVDAIRGLAIAINADPTESVSKAFSTSTAGRILWEIAHARTTGAADEEGTPNQSVERIDQRGSSLDASVADIYTEILTSLSTIQDTIVANRTTLPEKLFALYLFPIVLSLSNFRASIHDEISSSNDGVINAITQKLSDVEEAISNLCVPKESSGSFYLVVRAVPLNWQRKYSGGHYIWLEPGHRVEVLRRAGKWLEVRTMLPDHTEISGWVLKKYLRSLR